MNPAVLDAFALAIIAAAIRRLSLGITSHQPKLFFVLRGGGSEEGSADGFTRSQRRSSLSTERSSLKKGMKLLFVMNVSGSPAPNFGMPST